MNSEEKYIKDCFIPQSMQRSISPTKTFKSNLNAVITATDPIIAQANEQLSEPKEVVESPGTTLNCVDTLNVALSELDKTRKILAEKAKRNAKAIQNYARIIEEVDKRLAVRASDLNE